MSKLAKILTTLALVALVPCAEADVVLDVTKTEDTADGVCNADCSLREAVTVANESPDVPVVINVPAGTFALSIAGSDDTAAAGDLDILHDVEIVGAGVHDTIVDGNALDRVFHVDPSAEGFTVQMSGLTITGGSTSYGGGIYNRGLLTLSGVAISDNHATYHGGGVYGSGSDTLTLTDSTISRNTGNYGGGIYIANTSHLVVERATISSNFAYAAGGGLYAGSSGSVSLVNSTISDNLAPSSGGGLHRYRGTVTLTNCTLGGNSGTSNSSAIHVDLGTGVVLRNTLISGTCSSGITSEGGNLEHPGATCSLSQPNDQPSVAQPMLGLLRDNGGVTHTTRPLARQPGS